MKALVKSKKEKGIWLENIAIPTVSANEVLVKVKKTSICGTDLHIYNWDEWSRKTIPVPLVIGHEFCGEIVDFGSAVTKYKIGQRVSAEGHVVCNVCRNCRAGRRHLCRNTKGIGIHTHGVFCEFVSIPQNNIIVVPYDIDDNIASIFDPFGNAIHTALSFDLVGEDVLITGAGPIGIMSALIAKRAGAKKIVITDINPYKLELARKLELVHVIDSSTQNLSDIMKKINIIEGFDVGLEMSGSPIALRNMIDKMNTGGKIALLGIFPTKFEIDWNKIIFKMLVLKGVSGREMFDTWYKMIGFIQDGLDLSKLITHKYKIDNFQEGFDVMSSGNSGRIILDWT